MSRAHAELFTLTNMRMCVLCYAPERAVYIFDVVPVVREVKYVVPENAKHSFVIFGYDLLRADKQFDCRPRNPYTIL
jgi:hypothetical protein